MSDLNEPVVKRCLQEIKLGLKHAGILYSDVAVRLNVSEVTVKRMLNQRDIGLDRLLILAEMANLELGRLIQSAQECPQEHYYFTDKQDEIFDRHPSLFNYFTQLFYLGKSAEAVAEENGLTELSTYLYLRKLENIGLIELNPKNQFRFLVKAPLGFSATSRTLKKRISRHIQKTCEIVLSPDKTDEHFMIVKPLHLTHHNYQEMLIALRRVVDRYSEIAEQPENQIDELPDYQITLVGHPIEDEEFDLAEITNVNEESLSDADPAAKYPA